MKVFISGKSGVLAPRIINELQSNRIEYICLSRNGSQQHDTIQGSVNDPLTYRKALEQCEVVIHLAAVTDQNIPDYETYYETNVRGSETLMRTSIQSGIRRFIYISTSNTIGYGSNTEPGLEHFPADKILSSSNYVRSKLESEKILQEMATRGGIELIILNPCFMIGYGTRKNGSGMLYERVIGKRIAFYPPGGKNFIDARDAAIAVYNALYDGIAGERYLLGNINMSYREIYELLSKHNSKSTILLKIPAWILKIAGISGEILRFLGIRTVLSSNHMHVICQNTYYDSAKAVRELGLPQSDLDDSIRSVILERSQTSK